MQGAECSHVATDWYPCDSN